MSGEIIKNISDKEINTKSENTSKLSPNSRVDINVLLNRVRTKNKKRKIENFIFISLIACVVLITGIIASL